MRCSALESLQPPGSSARSWRQQHLCKEAQRLLGAAAASQQAEGAVTPLQLTLHLSFAPNSMPRNTRGNTSPGRSRPVLVKALQKCIASTLKTLKRGMSKITGNTVCVGFASLASRKEIHSYVVTENVFPHA